MMTFEEFQKKSAFTQEELVAYSRGELIDGGAQRRLSRLPGSLLFPFHEITLIRWSEESGTGRIEAVRRNRFDEWFYACHFLGDPVMPGCWGIDAVWQCLKFFAAWRGLEGCDKTLGIGAVSFTGQIRPGDRDVVYAVDILGVKRIDGETLISGKASVSVDGAPVYAVGSVEIGTAYWESDEKARRAGLSPEPPAGAQALLGRALRYDEFRARKSFSRAEITALSQGTLIEDPQVETGLLPSALMLEISRVESLRCDAALGEGEAVAFRDNTPLEWFYPMNDGIKPAALSIDGVWQILGLFLAWAGHAGTGRALGLERVEVFSEITPRDRLISYEIKIHRLFHAEATGGAIVHADASVWADGRPVLQCYGAKVGCYKNIRYAGYPRSSEMAFGGSLKVAA